MSGFSVVQGVLPASVPDDGTFTIAYPRGLGRERFIGANAGTRHSIVVANNDGYSAISGQMSLTFGNDDITVTNLSGDTWRAQARYILRLDVADTALELKGTPRRFWAKDQVFDGFTVQASNGTPPYAYYVAAGVLPDGLSIDTQTGKVTGTPTVAGEFDDIVLGVTDATDATAVLPAFGIDIADLEGSGGTTPPPDPEPDFDPSQYTWYGAWDPNTGVAATGGKIDTVAPAYGSSRLMTGGGTTKPDLVEALGPNGQDLMRFATSASIGSFEIGNLGDFDLVMLINPRSLAGDNNIITYAAGNTNGLIRINSGGGSLGVRRAGGAVNNVTLPRPFEVGRPVVLHAKFRAGTVQVAINGVLAASSVVSGTTVRVERLTSSVGYDYGPVFISDAALPDDAAEKMFKWYQDSSWLPNTFFVDEVLGDDASLTPWKSATPWKTLTKACASKAFPGDTFKCSGDFLGERLDPAYGGDAVGGHVTFEAISGGKNWGGLLTNGGWAADGAGIGTRILAYEPLAVWYHMPSGKTVHLVRRAGLGMDRSYEWISGTTTLRIRIDGQDFATSTASIRIADQTGTSFCSTALSYIRAKGWDIRHRTGFGIQTFGDEFDFADGKLCFNTNDGSGGGNSVLRPNGAWVIGNGQRVWDEATQTVVALNSEGDGISQHGTSEVHATGCIIADNGFGGFQHQQSVTASLTDSVLINNVRDTRISYNVTAGVGKLEVEGSLILVGDRSESGWGPYLGAGHPATSELHLTNNTIVCERASKAGTKGAYWPDGFGSANGNILADFETGLSADPGRVVTGAGNVSNTVLKAGSDITAGGGVADPLFVDKAARNFRLQAGSPAAGKGASATALDLMDQFLASEFS